MSRDSHGFKNVSSLQSTESNDSSSVIHTITSEPHPYRVPVFKLSPKRLPTSDDKGRISNNVRIVSCDFNTDYFNVSPNDNTISWLRKVTLASNERTLEAFPNNIDIVNPYFNRSYPTEEYHLCTLRLKPGAYSSAEELVREMNENITESFKELFGFTTVKERAYKDVQLNYDSYIFNPTGVIRLEESSISSASLSSPKHVSYIVDGEMIYTENDITKYVNNAIVRLSFLDNASLTASVVLNPKFQSNRFTEYQKDSNWYLYNTELGSLTNTGTDNIVYSTNLLKTETNVDIFTNTLATINPNFNLSSSTYNPVKYSDSPIVINKAALKTYPEYIGLTKDTEQYIFSNDRYNYTTKYNRDLRFDLSFDVSVNDSGDVTYGEITNGSLRAFSLNYEDIGDRTKSSLIDYSGDILNAFMFKNEESYPKTYIYYADNSNDVANYPYYNITTKRSYSVNPLTPPSSTSTPNAIIGDYTLDTYVGKHANTSTHILHTTTDSPSLELYFNLPDSLDDLSPDTKLQNSFDIDSGVINSFTLNNNSYSPTLIGYKINTFTDPDNDNKETVHKLHTVDALSNDFTSTNTITFSNQATQEASKIIALEQDNLFIVSQTRLQPCDLNGNVNQNEDSLFYSDGSLSLNYFTYTFTDNDEFAIVLDAFSYDDPLTPISTTTLEDTYFYDKELKCYISATTGSKYIFTIASTSNSTHAAINISTITLTLDTTNKLFISEFIISKDSVVESDAEGNIIPIYYEQAGSTVHIWDVKGTIFNDYLFYANKLKNKTYYRCVITDQSSSYIDMLIENSTKTRAASIQLDNITRNVASTLYVKDNTSVFTPLSTENFKLNDIYNTSLENLNYLPFGTHKPIGTLSASVTKDSRTTNTEIDNTKIFNDIIDTNVNITFDRDAFHADVDGSIVSSTREVYKSTNEHKSLTDYPSGQYYVKNATTQEFVAIDSIVLNIDGQPKIVKIDPQRFATDVVINKGVYTSSPANIFTKVQKFVMKTPIYEKSLITDPSADYYLTEEGHYVYFNNSSRYNKITVYSENDNGTILILNTPDGSNDLSQATSAELIDIEFNRSNRYTKYYEYVKQAENAIKEEYNTYVYIGTSADIAKIKNENYVPIRKDINLVNKETSYVEKSKDTVAAQTLNNVCVQVYDTSDGSVITSTANTLTLNKTAAGYKYGTRFVELKYANDEKTEVKVTDETVYLHKAPRIFSLEGYIAKIYYNDFVRSGVHEATCYSDTDFKQLASTNNFNIHGNEIQFKADVSSVRTYVNGDNQIVIDAYDSSNNLVETFVGAICEVETANINNTNNESSIIFAKHVISNDQFKDKLLTVISNAWVYDKHNFIATTPNGCMNYLYNNDDIRVEVYNPYDTTFSERFEALNETEFIVNEHLSTTTYNVYNYKNKSTNDAFRFYNTITKAYLLDTIVALQATDTYANTTTEQYYLEHVSYTTANGASDEKIFKFYKFDDSFVLMNRSSTHASVIDITPVNLEESSTKYDSSDKVAMFVCTSNNHTTYPHTCTFKEGSYVMNIDGVDKNVVCEYNEVYNSTSLITTIVVKITIDDIVYEFMSIDPSQQFAKVENINNGKIDNNNSNEASFVKTVHSENGVSVYQVKPSTVSAPVEEVVVNRDILVSDVSPTASSTHDNNLITYANTKYTESLNKVDNKFTYEPSSERTTYRATSYNTSSTDMSPKEQFIYPSSPNYISLGASLEYFTYTDNGFVSQGMTTVANLIALAHSSLERLYIKLGSSYLSFVDKGVELYTTDPSVYGSYANASVDEQLYFNKYGDYIALTESTNVADNYQYMNAFYKKYDDEYVECDLFMGEVVKSLTYYIYREDRLENMTSYKPSFDSSSHVYYLINNTLVECLYCPCTSYSCSRPYCIGLYYYELDPQMFTDETLIDKLYVSVNACPILIPTDSVSTVDASNYNAIPNNATPTDTPFYITDTNYDYYRPLTNVIQTYPSYNFVSNDISRIPDATLVSVDENPYGIKFINAIDERYQRVYTLANYIRPTESFGYDYVNASGRKENNRVDIYPIPLKTKFSRSEIAGDSSQPSYGKVSTVSYDNTLLTANSYAPTITQGANGVMLFDITSELQYYKLENIDDISYGDLYIIPKEEFNLTEYNTTGRWWRFDSVISNNLVQTQQISAQFASTIDQYGHLNEDFSITLPQMNVNNETASKVLHFNNTHIRPLLDETNNLYSLRIADTNNSSDSFIITYTPSTNFTDTEYVLNGYEDSLNARPTLTSNSATNSLRIYGARSTTDEIGSYTCIYNVSNTFSTTFVRLYTPTPITSSLIDTQFASNGRAVRLTDLNGTVVNNFVLSNDGLDYVPMSSISTVLVDAVSRKAISVFSISTLSYVPIKSNTSFTYTNSRYTSNGDVVVDGVNYGSEFDIYDNNNVKLTSATVIASQTTGFDATVDELTLTPITDQLDDQTILLTPTSDPRHVYTVNDNVAYPHTNIVITSPSGTNIKPHTDAIKLSGGVHSVLVPTTVKDIASNTIAAQTLDNYYPHQIHHLNGNHYVGDIAVADATDVIERGTLITIPVYDDKFKYVSQYVDCLRYDYINNVQQSTPSIMPQGEYLITPATNATASTTYASDIAVIGTHIDITDDNLNGIIAGASGDVLFYDAVNKCLGYLGTISRTNSPYLSANTLYSAKCSTSGGRLVLRISLNGTNKNVNFNILNTDYNLTEGSTYSVRTYAVTNTNNVFYAMFVLASDVELAPTLDSSFTPMMSNNFTSIYALKHSVLGILFNGVNNNLFDVDENGAQIPTTLYSNGTLMFKSPVDIEFTVNGSPIIPSMKFGPNATQVNIISLGERYTQSYLIAYTQVNLSNEHSLPYLYDNNDFIAYTYDSNIDSIITSNIVTVNDCSQANVIKRVTSEQLLSNEIISTNKLYTATVKYTARSSPGVIKSHTLTAYAELITNSNAVNIQFNVCRFISQTPTIILNPTDYIEVNESSRVALENKYFNYNGQMISKDDSYHVRECDARGEDRMMWYIHKNVGVNEVDGKVLASNVFVLDSSYSRGYGGDKNYRTLDLVSIVKNKYLNFYGFLEETSDDIQVIPYSNGQMVKLLTPTDFTDDAEVELFYDNVSKTYTMTFAGATIPNITFVDITGVCVFDSMTVRVSLSDRLVTDGYVSADSIGFNTYTANSRKNYSGYVNPTLVDNFSNLLNRIYIESYVIPRYIQESEFEANLGSYTRHKGLDSVFTPYVRQYMQDRTSIPAINSSAKYVIKNSVEDIKFTRKYTSKTISQNITNKYDAFLDKDLKLVYVKVGSNVISNNPTFSEISSLEIRSDAGVVIKSTYSDEDTFERFYEYVSEVDGQRVVVMTLPTEELEAEEIQPLDADSLLTITVSADGHCITTIEETETEVNLFFNRPSQAHSLVPYTPGYATKTFTLVPKPVSASFVQITMNKRFVFMNRTLSGRLVGTAITINGVIYNIKLFSGESFVNSRTQQITLTPDESTQTYTTESIAALSGLNFYLELQSASVDRNQFTVNQPYTMTFDERTGLYVKDGIAYEFTLNGIKIAPKNGIIYRNTSSNYLAFIDFAFDECMSDGSNLYVPYTSSSFVNPSMLSYMNQNAINNHVRYAVLEHHNQYINFEDGETTIVKLQPQMFTHNMYDTHYGLTLTQDFEDIFSWATSYYDIKTHPTYTFNFYELTINETKYSGTIDTSLDIVNKYYVQNTFVEQTRDYAASGIAPGTAPTPELVGVKLFYVVDDIVPTSSSASTTTKDYVIKDKSALTLSYDYTSLTDDEKQAIHSDANKVFVNALNTNSSERRIYIPVESDFVYKGYTYTPISNANASTNTFIFKTIPTFNITVKTSSAKVCNVYGGISSDEAENIYFKFSFNDITSNAHLINSPQYIDFINNTFSNSFFIVPQSECTIVGDSFTYTPRDSKYLCVNKHDRFKMSIRYINNPQGRYVYYVNNSTVFYYQGSNVALLDANSNAAISPPTIAISTITLTASPTASNSWLYTTTDYYYDGETQFRTTEHTVNVYAGNRQITPKNAGTDKLVLSLDGSENYISIIGNLYTNSQVERFIQDNTQTTNTYIRSTNKLTDRTHIAQLVNTTLKLNDYDKYVYALVSDIKHYYNKLTTYVQNNSGNYLYVNNSTYINSYIPFNPTTENIFKCINTYDYPAANGSDAILANYISVNGDYNNPDAITTDTPNFYNNTIYYIDETTYTEWVFNEIEERFVANVNVTGKSSISTNAYDFNINVKLSGDSTTYNKLFNFGSEKLRTITLHDIPIILNGMTVADKFMFRHDLLPINFKIAVDETSSLVFTQYITTVVDEHNHDYIYAHHPVISGFLVNDNINDSIVVDSENKSISCVKLFKETITTDTSSNVITEYPNLGNTLTTTDITFDFNNDYMFDEEDNDQMKMLYGPKTKTTSQSLTVFDYNVSVKDSITNNEPISVQEGEITYGLTNGENVGTERHFTNRTLNANFDDNDVKNVEYINNTLGGQLYTHSYYDKSVLRNTDAQNTYAPTVKGTYVNEDVADIINTFEYKYNPHSVNKTLEKVLYVDDSKNIATKNYTALASKDKHVWHNASTQNLNVFFKFKNLIKLSNTSVDTYLYAYISDSAINNYELSAANAMTIDSDSSNITFVTYNGSDISSTVHTVNVSKPYVCWVLIKNDTANNKTTVNMKLSQQSLDTSVSSRVYYFISREFEGSINVEAYQPSQGGQMRYNMQLYFKNYICTSIDKTTSAVDMEVKIGSGKGFYTVTEKNISIASPNTAYRSSLTLANSDGDSTPYYEKVYTYTPSASNPNVLTYNSDSYANLYRTSYYLRTSKVLNEFDGAGAAHKIQQNISNSDFCRIDVKVLELNSVLNTDKLNVQIKYDNGQPIDFEICQSNNAVSYANTTNSYVIIDIVPLMKSSATVDYERLVDVSERYYDAELKHKLPAGRFINETTYGNIDLFTATETHSTDISYSIIQNNYYEPTHSNNIYKVGYTSNDTTGRYTLHNSTFVEAAGDSVYVAGVDSNNLEPVYTIASNFIPQSNASDIAGYTNILSNENNKLYAKRYVKTLKPKTSDLLVTNDMKKLISNVLVPVDEFNDAQQNRFNGVFEKYLMSADKETAVSVKHLNKTTDLNNHTLKAHVSKVGLAKINDIKISKLMYAEEPKTTGDIYMDRVATTDVVEEALEFDSSKCSEHETIVLKYTPVARVIEENINTGVAKTITIANTYATSNSLLEPLDDVSYQGYKRFSIEQNSYTMTLHTPAIFDFNDDYVTKVPIFFGNDGPLGSYYEVPVEVTIHSAQRLADVVNRSGIRPKMNSIIYIKRVRSMLFDNDYRTLVQNRMGYSASTSRYVDEIFIPSERLVLDYTLEYTAEDDTTKSIVIEESNNTNERLFVLYTSVYNKIYADRDEMSLIMSQLSYELDRNVIRTKDDVRFDYKVVDYPTTKTIPAQTNWDPAVNRYYIEHTYMHTIENGLFKNYNDEAVIATYPSSTIIYDSYVYNKLPPVDIELSVHTSHTVNIYGEEVISHDIYTETLYPYSVLNGENVMLSTILSYVSGAEYLEFVRNTNGSYNVRVLEDSGSKTEKSTTTTFTYNGTSYDLRNILCYFDEQDANIIFSLFAPITSPTSTTIQLVRHGINDVALIVNDAIEIDTEAIMSEFITKLNNQNNYNTLTRGLVAVDKNLTPEQQLLYNIIQTRLHEDNSGSDNYSDVHITFDTTVDQSTPSTYFYINYNDYTVAAEESVQNLNVNPLTEAIKIFNDREYYLIPCNNTFIPVNRTKTKFDESTKQLRFYDISDNMYVVNNAVVDMTITPQSYITNNIYSVGCDSVVIENNNITITIDKSIKLNLKKNDVYMFTMDDDLISGVKYEPVYTTTSSLSFKQYTSSTEAVMHHWSERNLFECKLNETDASNILVWVFSTSTGEPVNCTAADLNNDTMKVANYVLYSYANGHIINGEKVDSVEVLKPTVNTVFYNVSKVLSGHKMCIDEHASDGYTITFNYDFNLYTNNYDLTTCLMNAPYVRMSYEDVKNKYISIVNKENNIVSNQQLNVYTNLVNNLVMFNEDGTINDCSGLYSYGYHQMSNGSHYKFAPRLRVKSTGVPVIYGGLYAPASDKTATETFVNNVSKSGVSMFLESMAAPSYKHPVFRLRMSGYSASYNPSIEYVSAWDVDNQYNVFGDNLVAGEWVVSSFRRLDSSKYYVAFVVKIEQKSTGIIKNLVLTYSPDVLSRDSFEVGIGSYAIFAIKAFNGSVDGDIVRVNANNVSDAVGGSIGISGVSALTVTFTTERYVGLEDVELKLKLKKTPYLLPHKNARKTFSIIQPNFNITTNDSPLVYEKKSYAEKDPSKHISAYTFTGMFLRIDDVTKSIKLSKFRHIDQAYATNITNIDYNDMYTSLQLINNDKSTVVTYYRKYDNGAYVKLNSITQDNVKTDIVDNVIPMTIADKSSKLNLNNGYYLRDVVVGVVDDGCILSEDTSKELKQRVIEKDVLDVDSDKITSCVLVCDVKSNQILGIAYNSINNYGFRDFYTKNSYELTDSNTNVSYMIDSEDNSSTTLNTNNMYQTEEKNVMLLKSSSIGYRNVKRYYVKPGFRTYDHRNIGEKVMFVNDYVDMVLTGTNTTSQLMSYAVYDDMVSEKNILYKADVGACSAERIDDNNMIGLSTMFSTYVNKIKHNRNIFPTYVENVFNSAVKGEVVNSSASEIKLVKEGAYYMLGTGSAGMAVYLTKYNDNPTVIEEFDMSTLGDEVVLVNKGSWFELSVENGNVGEGVENGSEGGNTGDEGEGAKTERVVVRNNGGNPWVNKGFRIASGVNGASNEYMHNVFRLNIYDCVCSHDMNDDAYNHNYNNLTFYYNGKKFRVLSDVEVDNDKNRLPVFYTFMNGLCCSIGSVSEASIKVQGNDSINSLIDDSAMKEETIAKITIDKEKELMYDSYYNNIIDNIIYENDNITISNQNGGSKIGLNFTFDCIPVAPSETQYANVDSYLKVIEQPNFSTDYTTIKMPNVTNYNKGVYSLVKDGYKLNEYNKSSRVVDDYYYKFTQDGGIWEKLGFNPYLIKIDKSSTVEMNGVVDMDFVNDDSVKEPVYLIKGKYYSEQLYKGPLINPRKVSFVDKSAVAGATDRYVLTDYSVEKGANVFDVLGEEVMTKFVMKQKHSADNAVNLSIPTTVDVKITQSEDVEKMLNSNDISQGVTALGSYDVVRPNDPAYESIQQRIDINQTITLPSNGASMNDIEENDSNNMYVFLTSKNRRYPLIPSVSSLVVEYV